MPLVEGEGPVLSNAGSSALQLLRPQDDTKNNAADEHVAQGMCVGCIGCTSTHVPQLELVRSFSCFTYHGMYLVAPANLSPLKAFTAVVTLLDCNEMQK